MGFRFELSRLLTGVGLAAIPVAIFGSDSGCMVVNSPVHTPELKQLAVADWQDIDEAKLKASLLKDLKSENPFRQESAIVRLNYYFPNLDDVSDADSKQTPTN